MSFQLRTAYVNYISRSGSWPFKVTGVESGVSFTCSGTETAGNVSSTTFEGQAAQAKTTTVTGSFNLNGQDLPLAGSSTAYVGTNYDLLGFSGEEYEVVTSSKPIPATAKVNDTGNWYTADRYSNSSKTFRLGTSTATYVLEPDTASTALLKIIRTERDTRGNLTSTSTITFRMTPAGELTPLKETTIEESASVTVTY